MIDDRTEHYDLPQPSASNTLAEDVGRLRSALVGVDSALYAVERQTGEAGYVASGLSAALAFLPNGLLSSISETLSDGRVRVTSCGYDINNQLTSLRVDLGSTRRTTTYTYNTSGVLTAWATTETPL